MITTARQNGEHSTRSSEKCYHILRGMLTCAQIPPGTRLREVEWSEKLGVQRAALREAMALLVHDGLLLRRSKGGFFTPRLDEIDIESVVDARMVLEVGGVKLTCRRKLKASAFQPVADVCDMMERCHKAGMASGFAEADFQFHQKLLELSGNARLIHMFSHSMQLFFAAAPMTNEARRAAEAITIREHREILSLVRQGDVVNASIQLELHLNSTKAGLFEVARQRLVNV